MVTGIRVAQENLEVRIIGGQNYWRSELIVIEHEDNT